MHLFSVTHHTPPASLTTDDVIKEYRTSLMGISMLSIMLFHQKWLNGAFFDFFHHTGHLGVDMFLLLSGWGIYHSLQKNSIITFFKNRFLRIIPTCLLAGWLQIAFDSFGFDGFIDLFPQYALRIVGLFKWYVIAIIIYYSLSPFIYWLQNRGNYLPFLIALSIVALPLAHHSHWFDAGSYIITTIPYVIGRLPVFLLGMMIAQKPITINRQNIAFGVIAYLIVLLTYYEEGIFSVAVDFACAVYLFALPFILFILSKVFHFVPFCKSLMQWIGHYTLELYLWQEFVFIAITNAGWIENRWLQLFAAVILTFFLAVSSQYVLRSIQRFRKCRGTKGIR